VGLAVISGLGDSPPDSVSEGDFAGMLYTTLYWHLFLAGLLYRSVTGTIDEKEPQTNSHDDG
jgi:hypothetical protein